MAGAAALVGSLLAYLVIVEGGMALWDKLQGDPEADVANALQQIQMESQLNARASLAAEQQGEERIQEQFSGFGGLGREALTSAAQLRRPGAVAGLRGGREVQGTPMGGGGDLLNYVSTKLGIPPEELTKRASPARGGDYTSIARSVGGGIPTR